MKKSREQTLIDAMFEIAVGMQMGSFKFKTRDEAAEFVAHTLKELGFPTEPRGMSWGVLTSSIKIEGER